MTLSWSAEKLPLLTAIEDHAQEIWQAAITEAKLHAASVWVKRLRENAKFIEPADEVTDEVHEYEVEFMGPRRCGSIKPDNRRKLLDVFGSGN